MSDAAPPGGGRRRPSKGNTRLVESDKCPDEKTSGTNVRRASADGQMSGREDPAPRQPTTGHFRVHLNSEPSPDPNLSTETGYLHPLRAQRGQTPGTPQATTRTPEEQPPARTRRTAATSGHLAATTTAPDTPDNCPRDKPLCQVSSDALSRDLCTGRFPVHLNSIPSPDPNLSTERKVLNALIERGREERGPRTADSDRPNESTVPLPTAQHSRSRAEGDGRTSADRGTAPGSRPAARCSVVSPNHFGTPPRSVSAYLSPDPRYQLPPAGKIS